jgi:hypothetical protein
MRSGTQAVYSLGRSRMHALTSSTRRDASGVAMYDLKNRFRPATMRRQTAARHPATNRHAAPGRLGGGPPTEGIPVVPGCPTDVRGQGGRICFTGIMIDEYPLPTEGGTCPDCGHRDGSRYVRSSARLTGGRYSRRDFLALIAEGRVQRPGNLDAAGMRDGSS